MAVNCEKVVGDLFAAWTRLNLDEVMSQFAEDAVWDNVPMSPAKGKQAIREMTRGFMKDTPASIRSRSNVDLDQMSGFGVAGPLSSKLTQLTCGYQGQARTHACLLISAACSAACSAAWKQATLAW